MWKRNQSDREFEGEVEGDGDDKGGASDGRCLCGDSCDRSRGET
jgi:hypothetical protein